MMFQEPFNYILPPRGPFTQWYRIAIVVSWSGKGLIIDPSPEGLSNIPYRWHTLYIGRQTMFEHGDDTDRSSARP
jgi:hypothetical protein